MVSRSVWDREGGGSSPPWVTIFRFPSMGKARYRSGLPTDKIAGYEPANEGSIPSPNTTFEPKKESYLYGIKNLSFTHLLVIRARRRTHFNQGIAQLAEHVLGVRVRALLWGRGVRISGEDVDRSSVPLLSNRINSTTP